MTTKLMMTPVTYAVEHTLSHALDVSTAFLKEIDRQTTANAALLARERAELTDARASSPRRRRTERRLHGNRIATAVDVTLFKKGKQQGDGVIRNVALRGLFVETTVELDENAVVQLRFCLSNEQGSLEPYQLWGVVAHSSEKGIGLHGDILHVDTDAALQALINRAES